jgi:hypothetical protein
MGVQFNKTFGANLQTQAAAPTTPKVPAKFWLNIGYHEMGTNKQSGEPEMKWISLPGGIPLDTAKPIDFSKSRDKEFIHISQARNALLEDILAECVKLAPGEDFYFDTAIPGLKIQFHAVKEAVEVPDESENPFRRKFSFA